MGDVTFTVEPSISGRQGPVSRGGKRRTFVFATFTMNASYATGGDSIPTSSLPTGIGSLKAIFVTPQHDGTRQYAWDGSTSAPKIKAWDGFAIEEGAATNLSTVTLHVLMVYEQG